VGVSEHLVKMAGQCPQWTPGKDGWLVSAHSGHLVKTAGWSVPTVDTRWRRLVSAHSGHPVKTAGQCPQWTPG